MTPKQINDKNLLKIRIENPIAPPSENDRLWKDVKKFTRLIPSEVEPNMGRVREIKEEIANGTYLSREVIEETAARLAIRFMRKE